MNTTIGRPLDRKSWIKRKRDFKFVGVTQLRETGEKTRRRSLSFVVLLLDIYIYNTWRMYQMTTSS
jgi:hypothetical protein